MIKANVSTVKNQLSRYLQKVRQGETVEIIDRDLPVARIVPIERTTHNQEEWLAHLVRLDLIKRGPMKGSKDILRHSPPGKSSVKVLDALLEERRGER